MGFDLELGFRSEEEEEVVVVGSRRRSPGFPVEEEKGLGFRCCLVLPSFLDCVNLQEIKERSSGYKYHTIKLSLFINANPMGYNCRPTSCFCFSSLPHILRPQAQLSDFVICIQKNY